MYLGLYPRHRPGKLTRDSFPWQLLDRLSDDPIGLLGIVQVYMVSGLLDDMQRALLVSRFAKSLDRCLASIRIHPVVIAVCNENQRSVAVVRRRGGCDSQRKVTGTLMRLILSTIGIRAYAPGASI